MPNRPDVGVYETNQQTFMGVSREAVMAAQGDAMAAVRAAAAEARSTEQFNVAMPWPSRIEQQPQRPVTAAQTPPGAVTPLPPQIVPHDPEELATIDWYGRAVRSVLG